MSGLTPLQPQGPLILEALRLVEGASTVEGTLAATPGAELKAVLAEINAQGLLLLLADGRSLTAAGKLPYPPGTELTFRVQPQADGSTQLQALRADPPPPPALLAPLVQGEATALLQRLAAPELPAELLPLKALLDRLPAAPTPPPATALPQALIPLAEALGLPGDVREATPDAPPAPVPSGTASAASPKAAQAEALPTPQAPAAPPSLGSLTALLTTRGLPPEPARALALLLLGEPAPPSAAKTVAARPTSEASASTPVQRPVAKVATPELDAPASERPLAAPSTPSTAPVLDRTLLRTFGLPEQLIEALVPEPTEQEAAGPSANVATPAKGSPEATAQLRQVLDRLPAPLAQRVLALLTLLPPPGLGQALPRQSALAELIRALMPQLQAKAPESPSARTLTTSQAAQAANQLQPSEPATWTRWLKEVVSTLSRPEASPVEAPFHRLQAREGTALFEVPLPWTPEPGTLELWAEREAPGPGRPEVHRVLLALNLGRTGELRVALQSTPAGVQAQVMAAPAVAARLESLLREELGEPSPFPLQVRAAPELPPRPRALTGTGLQALG